MTKRTQKVQKKGHTSEQCAVSTLRKQICQYAARVCQRAVQKVVSTQLKQILKLEMTIAKQTATIQIMKAELKARKPTKGTKSTKAK